MWVEIYSFDTFLLISEVGIPKFVTEEYIAQNVGISEFLDGSKVPKSVRQTEWQTIMRCALVNNGPIQLTFPTIKCDVIRLNVRLLRAESSNFPCEVIAPLHHGMPIHHFPFNNEFLLRQIISPLWNSAICHRTKCCYASGACRVLHG